MKKCKECGHEVSSKAKACPNCGAQRKEPTSLFTWIVAIIAFGWIFSSFNGEPTSSSNAKRILDPEEQAISQLKVDYEWRKVGFDNVLEADFTITNTGQVNVRDIEIRCTHFAKSGTEIDHNTETIFDVVKAKSTKQFKNVNMGFIHSQAHTSGCQVISLKTG